MKKPVSRLLIILVILNFSFVCFALLYANSLSLALLAAGLRADDLHEVEGPTRRADDRVFCVVQTSTEEDEPALALLVRNRIGFWTVENVETISSGGPFQWVSTTWILDAGGWQFDSVDGGKNHWEWHFAYYGVNAVALLELLPGQIPENVTVNIQQQGNRYWIHVISFEESGENASFDIISLLEENGCISPSNS